MKKEVQNVNTDNITTTSSSKILKELLGEIVKLTNGTEFETKSILKNLSNKDYIKMILDRTTPEIRRLLEEEMVLQAVYK